MVPMSKEDVIEEIKKTQHIEKWTERQFTGAGLFGVAWSIIYLAKTLKDIIYIRK